MTSRCSNGCISWEMATRFYRCSERESSLPGTFRTYCAAAEQDLNWTRGKPPVDTIIAASVLPDPCDQCKDEGIWRMNNLTGRWGQVSGTRIRHSAFC
ncbi:hypothetical protein DRE_00338 [Drechslerella stenobrocha 248]|uniref:Uncharacterized protein n=1 Tax=Drechslerella stenobrocha 248 TaxID=1043628 RepID=W7IEC5_9PEZI|nr:hypothetical protein DRE_00338 [Drechslerella stenobrocha 248]